jgi:uncharacterized protein YndB with AHSA1/START domain
MSGQTHEAECVVPAGPGATYAALLHPEQLRSWLAPEGAEACIEAFEPKVGARIRITLTFRTAPGKSTPDSDVIEGRILELVPGIRVVQAFTFRSEDPRFAGEMAMAWNLDATTGGTRVHVVATNVPVGIERDEHERGMRSTLENLRAYLASGR